MSRTDLFDRLLELNGAFTERETAGMAHNLLLAVRAVPASMHASLWVCVECSVFDGGVLYVCWVRGRRL